MRTVNWYEIFWELLQNWTHLNNFESSSISSSHLPSVMSYGKRYSLLGSQENFLFGLTTPKNKGIRWNSRMWDEIMRNERFIKRPKVTRSNCKIWFEYVGADVRSFSTLSWTIKEVEWSVTRKTIRKNFFSTPIFYSFLSEWVIGDCI